MIYLDNGATSYPKPYGVQQSVACAIETCGNPGRGGYRLAMRAARTVLECRQRAAKMFSCSPEQVVFTGSCTQGLNMAINTLFRPGSRVVITGFEHNAVTRPLYAIGAKVVVAGRKLFDWNDTIEQFEKALKQGVDGAVFTLVSNVFGYILPAERLSELCKKYGVPFVIDAAQGAGMLPIDMESLGADFIAMPGHKGLLGPQGTGILLCGRIPKPLIYGGTGSLSREQKMPDFLPDAAEAGTLNVPGIAGLSAGLAYLGKAGQGRLFERQVYEAKKAIKGLEKLGFHVFSGEHQGGTVSFTDDRDSEDVAAYLEKQGIAVRAGLHCAPLAHESAGTLETGTVRVSYGHDASREQTSALLWALDRYRSEM